MFLIFEGMDWEGQSVVACRATEAAAVAWAKERAKSLTCYSDYVLVMEFPDGEFDIPRYKPDERVRNVGEYRPDTIRLQGRFDDDPPAEPEPGPEVDAVPVQCGSSRESKKGTGKFYLPAGGPTRASIRRRVNRAAKRRGRRVLL